MEPGSVLVRYVTSLEFRPSKYNFSEWCKYAFVVTFFEKRRMSEVFIFSGGFFIVGKMD